MKELLGPQKAFTVGQLQELSKVQENSASGEKSCSSKNADKKISKATGSEDFAYFSQKVPSIMLSIAGGRSEDGYTYPLHHPKVKFDENVLSMGSAVYAYNAMRWLEEHT